jgi:CO dehydrogenase/acetyl-CoA synthase beta subunit
MYVYPETSETIRVTIEGVFPMSEADAVGFLNNIYTGKEPGGMEYKIFADDNGEGDRTVVYAGLRAAAVSRDT